MSYLENQIYKACVPLDVFKQGLEVVGRMWFASGDPCGELRETGYRHELCNRRRFWVTQQLMGSGEVIKLCKN